MSKPSGRAEQAGVIAVRRSSRGLEVCLIRKAKSPWSIPKGLIEHGDTQRATAVREAWEEARAELLIEGLLGVYSVPRISQVHIIYRARLRSPDVAAGEESLEVRLFAWDEIPWDDLAFESTRDALKDYLKLYIKV